MRIFEYDVVVVGGGSAGIAAGIASAETGAKTLVLERNPYFGGESTHSMITAYCGFHTRGETPQQVVYGIGERVLKTLRDFGADTDYTVSKSTGNASIRFNPELLKVALDRLMEESSADFLLHVYVSDVVVEENQIVEIECCDDQGKFIVKGKSFIDASGDANVAHMAGLKTMWGNEMGETQMASLSVRLENLPRNVDITIADLEAAIKKGKENGIEPLEKEKGMIIKILSEDYGYCTIPSVVLNKIDAKTLTEAEIYLRKQAYAYAEAFRRFMPGFEQVRISNTGPQLGIRESRRIIGETILTAQDVLECKRFDDSIGRGGWSPEIHKSNTELNYMHFENNYFQIPLRCLKAKDLDNLWCCGRNISCDSIAHASVRVMGTGFALGQAAGVAAAIQTKAGTVDYKDVQKELIAQGAVI